MRAEGELLRNMWLFPTAQGATAAQARTRLATTLRVFGLRLAGIEALGTARHTIVHRLLEIRVYRAIPGSAAGRSPKPKAPVRWLTPGQLARAPLPTLTRKIAAVAGNTLVPGR